VDFEVEEIEPRGKHGRTYLIKTWEPIVKCGRVGWGGDLQYMDNQIVSDDNEQATDRIYESDNGSLRS